jgi:Aspartyl protease
MPFYRGSLRLLVVAIAALAPCCGNPIYGQAAAGTSRVKFAAEVPLLDCDGTPCVDARIGDGKMVRFGIDTGNVDSVVDSKVAEAAGLKHSEPPKPGAPSGMYRTVMRAVHLGELTLAEVPAIGMDLSDMISQKQMPRVAGTLAYPAFKDRIVQLDFTAHKLRISDVLTAPVQCAGACDTMSLIAFGKEGPPIVVADGFEINGEKVSAQVDTMYTGSLLIYTASIEKLSLSGAAKTTDVRLFPLTDGGVNMKVAEAQSEGFGGNILVKDGAKVYFPTETVHEPDGLFDATAGLELFRDAVLTLDFHDMTIGVAKKKP